MIRKHLLIERGGIRFGLFGLMGTDSITFTINPGALTFPDPIETARNTAQQLRAEGAEVIICMSHGGVLEPKNGPIIEGDDVNLARAVPEIDIIVGGHTHTFMRTPVLVNGTPIVQAGCYGQAVGELVIEIAGAQTERSLSRLCRPWTMPFTAIPRLSMANRSLQAETSPYRVRADEV